jgi:hypothetical protein
MEVIRGREEIAVKKYVVRLDAEERDRLDELIRKDKRPTTSSPAMSGSVCWGRLR